MQLWAVFLGNCTTQKTFPLWFGTVLCLSNLPNLLITIPQYNNTIASAGTDHYCNLSVLVLAVAETVY